MDKNKYEVIKIKMLRTAEALKKNNFYCKCAENREEALEIVKSLINEGDSVSVGGSVTLSELGILEMLKDGPYNYLDRYEKGLSRAQMEEIYVKSLMTDVYLTSSNAITEDGELYNIDGNSNRVAAMLYGPKSVIVVAGYNKIVKDLDAAKIRLKEIAAPANAIRLNMGTPCTITGKCCDCSSENRICANTIIMARQRKKDRIKVILVAEELGY